MQQTIDTSFITNAESRETLFTGLHLNRGRPDIRIIHVKVPEKTNEDELILLCEESKIYFTRWRTEIGEKRTINLDGNDYKVTELNFTPEHWTGPVFRVSKLEQTSHEPRKAYVLFSEGLRNAVISYCKDLIKNSEDTPILVQEALSHCIFDSNDVMLETRKIFMDTSGKLVPVGSHLPKCGKNLIDYAHESGMEIKFLH